jgi:hypothetical protein
MVSDDHKSLEFMDLLIDTHLRHKRRAAEAQARKN